MPKYTLEQLQQTRKVLVDYGYANSVARIDIEIEKAKKPQEEQDFLERFATFLDRSEYGILTPDELAEETLNYLKANWRFFEKPQTGLAQNFIKESYNTPHDAPELLLLEDYEGDQWFRIGDRTFWYSPSESRELFTFFTVEDEFAPYTNLGWVPDGTKFWDNKSDSEKTVWNKSGFDSMAIV